MDLHGYIDRVEQAVDNPEALEALRDEVTEDESIDTADQEVLLERIGTYLADLGRSGAIDVTDEGEDAGTA